jgi:hypothetical protein
MDGRPWHEKLREDLLRQGLPASYIDRLVEELDNHVIDLQTENKSMDAHQAFEQLGTTQQLVAVARQEYRRHSFAKRHPWIAFVLGPVAFVPAVFALLLFSCFTLLWLIGSVLEAFAADVPEEAMMKWGYSIWYCLNGVLRFAPFALSAWLFCRWAQHNEMRRWAVVACAIVTLLATITFSNVSEAATDHQLNWTIGLASKPKNFQLVQALVPIAVGGWLLFRLPRKSPPPRTSGLLPETQSA